MDCIEKAEGTENNGVGDVGDEHKRGHAGSLLQSRYSHRSKLCSKKIWWQDVETEKQTSRQGRRTPEGIHNGNKLEQIKIFVSCEH